MSLSALTRCLTEFGLKRYDQYQNSLVRVRKVITTELNGLVACGNIDRCHTLLRICHCIINQNQTKFILNNLTQLQHIFLSTCHNE